MFRMSSIPVAKLFDAPISDTCYTSNVRESSNKRLWAKRWQKVKTPIVHDAKNEEGNRIARKKQGGQTNREQPTWNPRRRMKRQNLICGSVS